MKNKLFAATAMFAAASIAHAATDVTPGSKEAAAVLVSEFLPLVADASASTVQVASTVQHDDKMTVTAAAINQAGRKSCSVTMVKNAYANKTGWVVSAYACR